ncbi:MAG: DUF1566 domain-containing protein [Desulfatirhabdiaceae bacterium]
MAQKRTSFQVLVILFFTVMVLAKLAAAIPVPDTEVIKCYDMNSEILCPEKGASFYGQDGTYTINPPTYTKLGDGGGALPDEAISWDMVKDNITGLIWEVKRNWDSEENYDDPHDADNSYSWYDPNSPFPGTPGDGTDTKDFIDRLNAIQFGGFRDWRLPTVQELMTLVVFNPINPCIDIGYFPTTVSNLFWTSTDFALDDRKAWVISFYTGLTNWFDKLERMKVRAVRGGADMAYSQSDPFCCNSFQNGNVERYTDNGDGTVTDLSVGLTWQQDTARDNKGSFAWMTWDEALSYCEGLTLGGHSDWRLPNIKELCSVMDYSRWNMAINMELFPNTESVYWSSTTHSGISTGEALNVEAYYGGNHSRYSKSTGLHVRAVRGGQDRLLGHLFISAPLQASFLAIGMNTEIQWETQQITDAVAITLSRDGGKTWESIVSSTSNDGNHPWTVTGPQSVNCMLKIEPVSDPTKGTIQGLFTIYGAQKVKGDINGDGTVNLADAIAALQIMIDGHPSAVDPEADVNDDGKIGMAEVIYILQQVAGL